MSNQSNIAPVVVLCGVLGVDTNSTSQSQVVAFSCAGIADMWAFVEYVRDKHTGIEYAKPLQKLDQLSIAYKKLEDDARNYEKYKQAEERVRVLFDKCQSCYKLIESQRMGGFANGKYIEGYECEWKHIYSDGKPYFSEKQLEALSRVGSFVYTVESLKLGTLIDKLARDYHRALTPPKAYEVLADRTKEILRIANDPSTKSIKKKSIGKNTQARVLQTK